MTMFTTSRRAVRHAALGFAVTFAAIGGCI